MYGPGFLGESNHGKLIGTSTLSHKLNRFYGSKQMIVFGMYFTHITNKLVYASEKELVKPYV